MATRADTLPPRPRALPLSGPAVAGLSMLAAIALRWPHFGNPALHVDEDFYLLVGDRMLHGALPYVDVWDRKPIGLFLLYAGIRLLGGDAILVYQLVAALFAGGTAFLIARLVRPVAGSWAGLVGGLAYLLWIQTIEGDGGQSPIFYNGFVAAAALLTLGTIDRRDPRRVARDGAAAMALVGLAIQIKYTVVFEGLFFGLVLLARLRATGRSIVTTLAIGAALAGIALLPTLVAAGHYAAIGHFDDFWFANFGSILRRGAPPGAAPRLIVGAQHLLPLALCGGASLWWLRRRGSGETIGWAWFMAGWLIAALIGFAAIGAYYFHYLLPVYVPLAAIAAPIVERRPVGPVLLGVALWLPLANQHFPDPASARSRAAFDRLIALMPAAVGRHCLFVYDGPPTLYLASKACTLSRYLFPDHLSLAIEEKAIGVDPVAEVRRILAQRPAAITVDAARLAGPDRPSFEPVRAALARDYRLAGAAEDEGVTTAVYVRK